MNVARCSFVARRSTFVALRSTFVDCASVCVCIVCSKRWVRAFGRCAYVQCSRLKRGEHISIFGRHSEVVRGRAAKVHICRKRVVPSIFCTFSCSFRHRGRRRTAALTHVSLVFFPPLFISYSVSSSVLFLSLFLFEHMACSMRGHIGSGYRMWVHSSEIVCDVSRHRGRKWNVYRLMWHFGNTSFPTFHAKFAFKATNSMAVTTSKERKKIFVSLAQFHWQIPEISCSNKKKDHRRSADSNTNGTQRVNDDTHSRARNSIVPPHIV